MSERPKSAISLTLSLCLYASICENAAGDVQQFAVKETDVT